MLLKRRRRIQYDLRNRLICIRRGTLLWLGSIFPLPPRTMTRIIHRDNLTADMPPEAGRVRSNFTAAPAPQIQFTTL